MLKEVEQVRIDKWLWSVRIFKSRTLATDVCKRGKVKIDAKALKPSHNLQGGETLRVHKNGFNLEIKVQKLINKRVSAPLAQECYEDLTPIEEMNKFNDWFVGKGQSEKREKGAGRPTKRERREIDTFKNKLWTIESLDELDDEETP